MIIKIKNQVGLKIPTKTHDSDSCFDLIATSEPIIYGEKANFPLYNEYQSFGQLYSSISFLEYKTNIFIAPQDSFSKRKYNKNIHRKYCTFIYPRSSISSTNLIYCNLPVIDNGYRGELLIRMRYIIQPEDLCVVPISGITQIYTKINPEKIYHQGQKIGQLFITELVDAEFELVDNLDQTTRNSGSFGSSGK